MQLAIVGARGSGKSTLFTAFTGAVPDPTANPRDPARAQVRVRDPRLEWVREIYDPNKFTPAAIDVLDFPGLPDAGDMSGVKLAELLAAAREADGLIVCVRGFEDPTYPYNDPTAAPLREADHVQSELAFADLEVATRRVEKLERKGGNRTDAEQREFLALGKVVTALEDGMPVKSVELTADEEKLLRGFRFLTAKPWVLVLSQSDADESEGVLADVPGPFDARLAVRAKLEAEVAELDEEDRALFMEDLGLTSLASESVLRAAFEGLGTIVFFTTGPDECRAWPIPEGSSAVEAAGAIHSDLARGFIRAEVYHWDDLREFDGDEQAVKKAGRFRLEGKTYTVKDGDILHVRFSV